MKGKAVGAVAAYMASLVALSAACGGSRPDCQAQRTCSGGGEGGVNETGGNGGVTDEGGASQGGDVGGEGPEMTAGQAGMPSGGERACASDADCDGGDPCDGPVTCVDELCVQGNPVECDPGLTCSMGECIFLGRAPWIFFDASSQSEWRGEVYAVRSDLVGTMAPVLITVDRAGWFPAGFRGFLWAPDGTMAVVPAVNGSFASDAFLWRPGRGLPDPAVPLVEDEPRADFQALSWSPSSRALAYVRHDGRLDFIEISPVGELVRSKIDTAERVIDVWVKNDNELVYTTLDFMTSLATLVLATRSDGTWSTYPLGSTTSFDRYHSPDLTFVDFITRNQMTGLSTYWVVETKNGSEPIAVTDPAQDVGISWSPDGSQFIVAATDATNATVLHAGPVSNLSSPPLLKQDLGLRATRADSERGWAPDSSRAALFQKGTFDRQLAMYEVGQGEQWHPLPRQGCESHVWSPNSKLLAIHTRSAADAKPTLTLVESPGYALRDIATAPLEAATSVDWGVPRFSADSGFLVYQVVAKKFYIDLRLGLEAAADPIELPGGIDGRHSFSTSGAGLVYVNDDKDCVYLNLSSKTPSTAIRVNDMGAVQDCGFQPLLP